MLRKGKTISTRDTGFNILDVLQDPSYKKHFMFRFKIAKEKMRYETCLSSWYICYKDSPEMFLEDILDETKRMLGMQKSSCILCNGGSIWENIVMPACSDYICEKTGQPKPFEYVNCITSQEYNFDCYYANPNRKKPKEGCWGK